MTQWNTHTRHRPVFDQRCRIATTLELHFDRAAFDFGMAFHMEIKFDKHFSKHKEILQVQPMYK